MLNQEKCASGPVSPIISATDTFHMKINSYSALNALAAIATKHRVFLEGSLASEASGSPIHKDHVIALRRTSQ